MKARAFLAVLSAAGLAFAATVVAEQSTARDRTPPAAISGAASVSGVVLNDATGKPLRRATVLLLASETTLRLQAVTGDDGRFGFSDLPAGRYNLSASRIGYVRTAYGAKKPGRPGVAVSVADGEKKTDLTVRLPPGAVIAGAVRNPSGEPMPGLRVMLLQRSVRFDTGESTLVRADTVNVSGLGDLTDDRGAFRWFGLAPNDYYVVVTPVGPLVRNTGELHQVTPAELDWAARILREPGGASLSTPAPPPGPAVDYAVVFYPGVTTAARATAVSVRAGEERDGVDILLDFVPTAKITGTVSMPGGGPPPPLQVSLVAHEAVAGIPFNGFGNARTDANGQFSSGSITPGDYTIMVRTAGPAAGRADAPPASASPLFGLATVTVNGGDVNVPITLEPGVMVSGHVTFAGNAPPPRLAAIRVTLLAKRSSAPSLGVPPATTDASGAFTFTGVAPGSYHLAALIQGGWDIRSASGGGQEGLDGYIDVGRDDITDAVITFTNQVTEVSGSLVDGSGKPAPDYTIIVFPSDTAYWQPGSRRIQSAKPATDGRFKVSNLPPGDYRIAAVTDVEQGEWYSPGFLADLVPASRAFTLADGQKIVQDLKLAGGS